MVGIYRYENGLQFTGVVASTVEDAKTYLGNKYGKIEPVFVGFDESGKPAYEEKFVPFYNKDAFEIKELVYVV